MYVSPYSNPEEASASNSRSLSWDQSYSKQMLNWLLEDIRDLRTQLESYKYDTLVNTHIDKHIVASINEYVSKLNAKEQEVNNLLSNLNFVPLDEYRR